jgi:hypothetical protein
LAAGIALSPAAHVASIILGAHREKPSSPWRRVMTPGILGPGLVVGRLDDRVNE